MLETIFLESAIKRSAYYKTLGDGSFAQISEEAFHARPNQESNSIAVIVRHLAGNMLSRWTNFLTEDGEKSWRERDAEFEEPELDKAGVIALWEKGWDCYLSALRSLSENDLTRTITIRSEQLTVVDAINRQLAHYPYHVGQIVYLARMYKGEGWKSLSIPRGDSQAFNKGMGHGPK
jgi:uncharacterized damage-inducible protein DinB